MEKKVFAIKIPEIEKEAMEFTAKTAKKTLTSLYHKGLQKTLHEILGAVLLQQLDPRMDVLQAVLNDDEHAPIPPIVGEILEIIDSGEKEEFKKIFYNVKPVEVAEILEQFDVRDLARYIGRRYIGEVGEFNVVMIDAVENMLYDYILSLYYKLSVVGSMLSLQQEWQRNRMKIEMLKYNIMKIHHEKYGGAVVTPLRVSEEEK
ncbi:MAG: hypothetical protein DRN20_01125 [Thermoplasmata archaeon]|nr:MAG: hypothetical protein DRN20_01125 [Thermoplasmata archaeon]